jgi:hypothetical protein
MKYYELKFYTETSFLEVFSINEEEFKHIDETVNKIAKTYFPNEKEEIEWEVSFKVLTGKLNN